MSIEQEMKRMARDMARDWMFSAFVSGVGVGAILMLLCGWYTGALK